MWRVLLLLVAISPASAQSWGGGATVEAEAVGDRGTWVTSTVRVSGRAGDLGGGVVEAGAVDRFGATAPFVGADLYPDLGRGVSGNVRGRWAPGSEVTAQTDLAASLSVALGGGWVASVGARRMAFADQAVVIATGGAEVYRGAWLLRGEAAIVPGQPGVPVSARVVARRFGDTGGGAFGSFWEVSAGRGQEVRVEAEGQSSVRDAWSVGARAQRPLVGRLGGAIGAGYTADGDLSRSHAEAGVFVRW